MAGEPVLRPHHVLPPPLTQKAMVAARDERRPVIERDAVRRLDYRPVIENLRQCVVTGVASPNRAVDSITDAELGEWLRSAVRHQDRRVTACTIGAPVSASPVWIHAEAKPEVGAVVLGEDALRLIVVEVDALFGRLARVVFDRKALEAAVRVAERESAQHDPILY